MMSTYPLSRQPLTFAGLLLTQLWLGSAAALAEAASATTQPQGWVCASCDPGRPWTINLGLVPVYVADDAYRFGDYTGLDEKGAYLTGDVRAEYRDDQARYFYLDGFMRSPDATGLFAEGGRQGNYEIRGSWQSIPRRFFDTTLTPFAGSGSALLSLPDNWVRAPVTGGMSVLGESLTPVSVKRDLDVLKLGATIHPSSRWKLEADYRRQQKKGQSLSAGSVLFSSTEFVSPIDYSTDDLELALTYGGDTWQASVRYLGSFFENGNERLTWENPFTSVPGADVGNQALAPDNEMHQVTLAGAFRLPKRTVVSGQLAFGSLSQDEDLEPYTLNSTLPTSPLPMTSTDGRADTLNLNLRVVSSPWRRITLEGEVRLHEFDNQRPVRAYDYVVTDAVPAIIAATNLAYDYERSEWKLRGEYRPGGQLKLHLGLEQRRFERNAQARSQTTTDKLWFRLNRRLAPGVDVEFDLFTEQRDGSSYEDVERLSGEQNPLMRKYNLSDRERYGLRLRGGFYPGDRWDFGWEFEYGEDDYEETDIGLTATRYARAGLDASVMVGSGRNQGALYGALYTETVEARQANSQSFSAPDWTATTADQFDTASIGFEHPRLFGPMGLNVEYSWSLGRGETDNDTSGLKTDFPDITSRRQRFDLGLTWPVGDAWTLGVSYLFESVKSDDWGLAGLEPSTVPNLLSLGADPFNYEVNVIYLSFRYVREER